MQSFVSNCKNKKKELCIETKETKSEVTFKNVYPHLIEREEIELIGNFVKFFKINEEFI